MSLHFIMADAALGQAVVAWGCEPWLCGGTQCLPEPGTKALLLRGELHFLLGGEKQSQNN